ncbi:MAG TPA: hypothetical protein VFG76_10820 [Candidatus Polarisedimenticolia bacterium]|nr:hypothetical protein [Candidatus Polarisedimenticolia bacterium]
MADLIKRELGHDAVLAEGGRGEFSVLVDGRIVARRRLFGLPSDLKVLEQVRRALSDQASGQDHASQG